MVPTDWFDEAIEDLPPNQASAERLAERFSVSREFVYREFRERNLITAGEYQRAARQGDKQIQSGSGAAITIARRLPISARSISTWHFGGIIKTALITTSSRTSLI